MVFLKNLFNVYSTYDMQKDSSNTRQTQVTEAKFSQFMRDLKKLNIEGYDENFQYTADRLRSLNQVLSSTVGSKVDISCSDAGEVFVKGDFIKISDFTSPDGKPHSYCSGKTITALNVYATNTLFIDRDFDGVGNKLRMSLVAPKWWIVGDKKISLNGADNTHNFGTPKSPVNDAGVKGTDGEPGLPGGTLEIS